MPELSIVIPAYNEAENLPVLISRLRSVLAVLPCTAEVIFVDDHSMDGSADLLSAACIENGFRYLRLSRNSGSHIAVLAGLRQATGNCAVFMAADMQDPPELIERMLEPWRTGAHVVWAVRERREGVPLMERVLARIFYVLLNAMGNVQLPPTGSDFALLDRKVIDALLLSAASNTSLGGEIARLGFSQAEIQYTKERRQFGRSKWTLNTKLKAFADAFASFSYAPLRFMSYAGLLFSLVGFAYALVLILLRLRSQHPVEGWSSLMVVVLVLGGVQMIMLGILGEYLWRTLEESRHRPLYFIESSIGCETGATPDATASIASARPR